MQSFFEQKVYDKIRNFIHDSNKIILLSHLDADGLSSSGIIGRLLKSLDKDFTVKVLKQLEDDKLFKSSDEDLIIITDMGSGQLSLVKDYVECKKFIIIDHHQAQGVFEHDNLIHFNPGMHDESYSASGLCYLIARNLNPSLNGLVHLALVGATGDMQYDNKFIGLNKEILDYGVENGYLSIIKGLNLFGRVSRPLHETLANSLDLLIPGVSSNESAAIEFLSDLNIDLKNEGGEWKTLAGLNENELKKLVSSIIIRRVSNNLDSNILSEIIVINNRKGVLSDLKEWSVLLNACGRQEVQGLGVLLCMGYESYALPLIENVMKEYKVLLSKALNLVKNNSSIVKVEGDLLIIRGGSSIKDTIIGTIGGLLLKDSAYKTNTFIGFADRDEFNVKVSCRTLKNVNLGVIIKGVCELLNCNGGGHKGAGGALIRKEDQEEFLNLFKKELEKHL